jgi:drug/metabolite transporter (DMT)-like permease
MLLGILLAFVAAGCQSTSYVCSQLFSHKYPGRTFDLIALAHIAMSVFALLLLPFVWPDHMPPFAQYAPSMIACSGFYLIGQVSLLVALKTSSASRVSPLLGIKVLILALIGIFFLGQHFGRLQWAAIAMSVAAAAMLSRTGEKLSLKGMLWILLTCIFYCLSDINIKIVVGHFDYLGLAHSSVLSVCLCYIVCGIAGLVIFTMRITPWLRLGASQGSPQQATTPTMTMLAYSLPFAATWFAAMMFLFACFASIGVVYGNIVQSSRGILSIFLGALLVRYNFEHLDQRVSRGVFFQRLAAAVLMSCAIALYYLGA